MGNLLEDNSSNDKPDNSCKLRIYGNRLVHIGKQQGNVLYSFHGGHNDRKRSAGGSGMVILCAGYHNASAGGADIKKNRVLSAS